ncbi:cysteine desulfurase CsdA [Utexia brackfieldae]|uniref:cysteine desulfurase CsdA n=1 Tax=Utexia brackfieldae TaxID=3074108 RepID=UPI00370D1F2C
MTFDVIRFRENFPALTASTVYLDTAATALKPAAMISATDDYYGKNTANAYRSLHQPAQQATQKIEQTRQLIAQLINASDADQIIWTKGTTESINLVAQTYAKMHLKPGDEIIVSELEHHSNLVPWLILAEQTGAKIIKWPLNQACQLDKQTFQQLLTAKTRVVAMTQMSNVTGYQPHLAEIVRLTHQHEAIIVVDGAQGIVHAPIDVTTLGIDFYAFSAHKLYGPTGLGILYVKPSHLTQMPVWQGGGKMLKTVSFEGFEPQPLPAKLEAGTPNIAAILGFHATLNWLKEWDRSAAEQHALALAQLAEDKLIQFRGFQSYRDPDSPILSFNLDQIHHSDIAILLAEQHIAIRTGELCAQPLIKKLACTGVIRAAFAPYNTQQDVEQFIEAMAYAIDILS